MNFPSYNWEPSVLIGKRTRFPSFSLIYKMNGGYWLSSIISLLFWSPWLLKTNPFSGAIKTHSYFLGMAMKTCVGSSSQSLMLYESVCGGLANVSSVHYVSFNGSQFCWRLQLSYDGISLPCLLDSAAELVKFILYVELVHVRNGTLLH